MLLPLFAACTKTSHLFTIHPLRYYFFFFYSFHSIDLAIPVLVYTCRGLSGYFWLHLRPPINQPALDAYLLFMTVAATKPNYLTVYSFQLFITPLFVQFLVYTCRGLSIYFNLHPRPHKPTSARCWPAIYDCSSRYVKLPNCL